MSPASPGRRACCASCSPIFRRTRISPRKIARDHLATLSRAVGPLPLRRRRAADVTHLILARIGLSLHHFPGWRRLALICRALQGAILFTGAARVRNRRRPRTQLISMRSRSSPAAKSSTSYTTRCTSCLSANIAVRRACSQTAGIAIRRIPGGFELRRRSSRLLASPGLPPVFAAGLLRSRSSRMKSPIGSAASLASGLVAECHQ